MTTDSTPPAGGNGGAGGTDEKPNTVSRDAYETLLGEKKKMGERFKSIEAELETFRAEKAKRDEEDLKRKNDYETLLKKKDDELTALKSENGNFKLFFQEQKKLGSFLRTLGAPLEQKWHHMIDLEKIKVGNDGAVDEESVTKYVEEYKKTYPETLGKGTGGGMPDTKPGSGGGALKPEDWAKLPLAERRKRMGDVKY